MSFQSTINAEEIEKLDLAEFKGEIVVIEEISDSYYKAVEFLKSQKFLGFDTETKPSFHANEKRNKVALLQLSGDNKAIIIRLTHIGVTQEIAEILSNKNIVKIGAAVHDDIKGLQAYHKFEPGGFRDIQVIGKEWGISEKSVRKMTAIILNFRVSKSQQLSNWEAQTLTPAQINYAAIDAWVCLKIYLKLLKTPKKTFND